MFLWWISFALAACGGGGAGAPAPITARPGGVPTQALTPAGLPSGGFPFLDTPMEGQIVYANGTGDLFVTEVKPGAKAAKLTSLPNNQGYYQEPTWSPDGKRVMLSYLLPFDSSGLPAQDILIMDVGGSAPQPLIAHTVSGEVIGGPVFSPDGKTLYYSRSTPIFKGKAVTGVTLQIERYDMQSKQTQTVTADGVQPDVSPDGKRLAFLRINPETFQQDLMVVDVDGQNLEAVMAGNAVSGMMAPRWSRDGKRILFAIPNSLSRYVPPIAPISPPAARLPAWLERALGVRTAEAHGPPWDFWIVDANGENLKRLTSIGEDEPSATWSPDGKYFAFVGVAGFYVVDESGKQVRWLSRDGGKGRSDWRK
ncbi:MAG: PD40 domain-containing protein [Chloroflexi bacterium]|nr:PD40 domain-containing protein [Chloroflexota bacterium]